MTFKEWGEELDQERHIPAAEMYADWKAEREKVEIALLATRQQRDNEFNRAEKAEAGVKELEEEIIEREKRERYLADSNAVFVELLPQKDTHIGELEKGISEIIDCVAKVSVDIHHSEPGEEWRSPPFLAEKEKV